MAPAFERVRIIVAVEKAVFAHEICGIVRRLQRGTLTGRKFDYKIISPSNDSSKKAKAEQEQYEPAERGP
jgi:hypothetical protein